MVPGKQTSKLLQRKRLSFVLLVAMSVSHFAAARAAISILDNEIRCRCGFDVRLQNGKQMLIDIIEDTGVVDFCDSKGQEECVDFCRYQVRFSFELNTPCTL